MVELLEMLAKALVDQPDDVKVEVVDNDNAIILQLHVAPDDMGKIIGRQGRVAKALRTVIKAAAVKEGKKALVEIVD